MTTDNPDPPPEQRDSKSSLAEGLARRAAKLAKAAKPHVERFAAEAGPRVQQTGRDALQFAKEHEDEIRDTASKLVKARLGGPLGLAVDAFSRAGAKGGARTPDPTVICPSCAAANPMAAKFCNQCGSGLELSTPE